MPVFHLSTKPSKAPKKPKKNERHKRGAILTLGLALVTLAPMLAMTLAGTSCGVVKLDGAGGGASQPAGNLVASGTLSSLNLNGQDVSGAVSIYDNNGSYALWLQSLSAPSDLSIVMVVTTSAGTLPEIGLSTNSGSQTYSLSVNQSNPSFSQVQLFPSGNLSTPYASASLQ